MKGAWRLAARNLRRNRRRNLAVGLAITIGFAGLSLMGGYFARVDIFLRTCAVYLQHGGHLRIYHKDGFDRALAKPARFSLTQAQQDAIRQAAAEDPRVALTAGYLRGMGLAGNGCRSVPFLALGIDPQDERQLRNHPDVLRYCGDLALPLRGRPLYQAADVEGGIGLASGLSALLGKTRVHDDFPRPPPVAALPDCNRPGMAALFAADASVQLAGAAFDGSVTALDAEVVQIFHTPSIETEDLELHAGLAMLQRFYDTDSVSYMALYLRDERDAPEVGRQLRARIESRGIPAAVYEFTEEKVNPYYVGTMTFIRSMAGFIILIVSAVVVLGVMNTTTITVYERSRELGTLRALGYRKSQVVGLMLREVFLIGLSGILSGLVLAQAVAWIVQAANLRVKPPGVPGTMQIVIPPNLVFSFWVGALMLSLSLAVAWLVVGRRLRERTSELLIAINA